MKNRKDLDIIGLITRLKIQAVERSRDLEKEGITLDQSVKKKSHGRDGVDFSNFKEWAKFR